MKPFQDKKFIKEENEYSGFQKTDRKLSLPKIKSNIIEKNAQIFTPTLKPPLKNETHKDPYFKDNISCCSFFSNFSEKPSNVNLSNQKFFKIKEKNKFINLKTKIHHGKSISLEMLTEIKKKEDKIIKIENSRNSQNFAPENYSIFHKEEFFHKNMCKQKTIQANDTRTNSYFNKMTEEQFTKFVKYFYENKLVKSSELMDYFKNKNTEKIVYNMVNYFFKKSKTKQDEHDENLLKLKFLEETHANFNITQESFNKYKGLTIISMREFGFSEDEIDYIISNLENYKPAVVKKPTFKDIAINNNSTFKNYIENIEQNIKANGFLSHIFVKMDNDQIRKFFNTLINMIMIGMNKYIEPQKQELISIIKNFNNGEMIDWKQCFEMKNVLINSFLDGKTLTFKQNSNNFLQNISNLHKYIFSEPNLYQPDDTNLSVDQNLFVPLFCKALENNKELSKLFSFWPISRLQNHCKQMLYFLIRSPHSVYELNDLIPTHSGCLITNKEFYILYEIFYSLLKEIKTNEEEIDFLLSNLEQTLSYISRENIYKKFINEIPKICDLYVESIYVPLFGNIHTKKFFYNTDINYIKYKQKLFFIKLFRNEIGRTDLVDLKAIHSKIHLKDAHFDLFLKFSEETFVEMHLDPIFLKIILQKILKLRRFICVDE